MAKKYTKEEALGICEGFGVDEEGNPGIDISSASCQYCEENDPDLYAQCREECFPEEEKPKPRKSRKKASRKTKTEPEPEAEEQKEPDMSEPKPKRQKKSRKKASRKPKADKPEIPIGMEQCTACEGSGKNSKGAKCPICKGKGYVPVAKESTEKGEKARGSSESDSKGKNRATPAKKKKAPEKPAKKAKADKPKRKPKRLDVLIELVNRGKARTIDQYAEEVAKKVPQDAKAVTGLIKQCFRFAVGIGLAAKDEKGKYTFNE